MKLPRNMFPFDKQMFLFTKWDFFYAAAICLMFGCSIGLFVFVSRTDDVCHYFRNKGLCYTAIGSGSAAINAIAWPFMHTYLKTGISLISILPLSSIYAGQMTIMGYVETLKPLKHMYSLTNVPLEVAECLKEEVAYSVALMRRNLFGESHVHKLNTAVIQVAQTFDVAKQSQDKFRDAIESAFKWLEEKGMTCEQTLVRPAKMCQPVREFFRKCYDNHDRDQHSMTDEELHYCSVGTYKTFYYEPDTRYNHTWEVNHNRVSQWFYGIYCDGVTLLSNAVCGIFSKEAITEMLLHLRDRITAWISDAIRMRMGIQFHVHTTAYIEDELTNAWAPFKKALQTGGEFIGWAYNFVVLFVSRYVGFFLLCLYPICYAIQYNRGPLLFDNKYIPGSLQEKEWSKMTEDTPDDIKFLPLQTNETRKLQMAPAWIPSPEEIKTFLQSLIFTADLIVILVLLIIDYYYTQLVDATYYGSIMLFNRYQGVVFEFVHKPDLTGMAVIGQMMVEQLDKLQQAAGLGRMVACARRAPPIEYGYEVFLLTFIMRIVYLYGRVKLSWLSSMICARYNEHRHNQRMRCLKARTLLVREGYEPPAMFPWLRSLFRSYSGFNTGLQLPSWLRAIMNAKDTFNI